MTRSAGRSARPVIRPNWPIASFFRSRFIARFQNPNAQCAWKAAMPQNMPR